MLRKHFLKLLEIQKMLDIDDLKNSKLELRNLIGRIETNEKLK